MRFFIILLAFVVCFGMVGCGSSTKKAKKQAQKNEIAAKSESRIQLMEQYNACVKKADGDAEKVKACEAYLKAAEKIK